MMESVTQAKVSHGMARAKGCGCAREASGWPEKWIPCILLHQQANERLTERKRKSGEQ